MNKTIIETLSAMGFSDQEAEVYLCILSLGTPSVTEIAKKIGKARNAAYFHIKNLKEKGFLSETRVGKRQHYVALPPIGLAKHFETVTARFESLIPQIKILNAVQNETPVIEVTESRQGYLKIYHEISQLPENSVFRVIEGKKALITELNLLTEGEWNSFFKQIIQKKIVTKAIFTEECKTVPAKQLSLQNQQLIKKREWELKLVSEKVLAIQQLMFIYNDKVSFLFPDSSLVVTITHKGIAETLVASFDALHAFAGEPHSW